MSDSASIKELLDGVEVEWKSLGEIAKVKKGKQLNKSDLVIDGKYPAYNGGVTYSGFTNQYNVEENTIIISQGGASAGFVQFVESQFWANAHCFYMVPTLAINNKYLFYFLKNNQTKLMQCQFGAGIPALKKSDIEKLQIPIPPLDIQTKIVHILDNFTELTAELTAERTARKKQYSYYRDKLLGFEEDDVEWKTLGEVAIFCRGTAITKKETTNGKIPVIANGPLATYFHGEKNREGETIVIARSGAYAGYVSFWNHPIFLTDAFSVHPDSKVFKSKFIYYFLQKKQDYIHAMKKGAGVPHVRVKEFESFNVPIPSLIEQARIVSILDKFDTLTNSISEGLPKEIKLRQKQYEYYRDLLLNFSKPEIEA